MTGTIIIRDVSGAVYEVESRRHEEFMGLRADMRSGGSMLIVTSNKHIAINALHVISIEWTFDQ